MRLCRLFLIGLVLLLPINLSFAQNIRPIVKLVYFVPNDREAQPDINAKMDTLIKGAQQFFADEMERHGFGKKTFLFETDEDGNAIVHRVNGEFNEAYYNENSWSALEEMKAEFDISKDIYFLMLEVGNFGDGWCIPGLGLTLSGTPELGGAVLLPAFGDCFGTPETGVAFAAHELGHACGLRHDFRGEPYLMSYAEGRNKLSQCAAEWLAVHRAFNPAQAVRNAPPTFKMLPPKFVSETKKIRLRFEVSDADQLHQAQVFTEIDAGFSLIACKRLDGTTRSTFMIDTTYLTPLNTFVNLHVIDKRGNYHYEMFEIDIKPLLPPPKVVSIPDMNLAAAIRDQIGNSITTHTMLNLKRLDAADITDLTGLEHAHNITQLSLSGRTDLDNNISLLTELTQLTSLSLWDSAISDISPLTELAQLTSLSLTCNAISDISPLTELTQLTSLSLWDPLLIKDMSPLTELTQLTSLKFVRPAISDISPLAELTQLTSLDVIESRIISDISPLSSLTKLKSLNIYRNNISDVSPLSGLTNLTTLTISQNSISDVSPLSGLTRLSVLVLDSNQISDVRPLSGLVNLERLTLVGNPIKNRKPLLELLRKNPEIKIYLKNNREPLPVTLSLFRAELTDSGIVLKWTTESELDNAGFYIYRSQTKDVVFKVVNPTMVQGAGTTSERNEYTWTDTTAKPNTVYYYRIEDVSHAGVREQLATVRLRGLVSASGKRTTKWADLKNLQ